jgi:hypothetical protein
LLLQDRSVAEWLGQQRLGLVVMSISNASEAAADCVELIGNLVVEALQRRDGRNCD